MGIQHSPLPWSVDPENPAGVLTEDRLDTPWAIAHCAGFAPQDLNGIGNAAFIVRACNAHYEMRDALYLVLNSLGWQYLSAHTKPVIRAAIAAAEAEDR